MRLKRNYEDNKKLNKVETNYRAYKDKIKIKIHNGNNKDNIEVKTNYNNNKKKCFLKIIICHILLLTPCYLANILDLKNNMANIAKFDIIILDSSINFIAIGLNFLIHITN